LRLGLSVAACDEIENLGPAGSDLDRYVRLNTVPATTATLEHHIDVIDDLLSKG
jgi:hypothetical protein